jgi:hypothetical protein
MNSSKTTDYSQNSQWGPYAPTVPAVGGLINDFSTNYQNPALNGTELGAIQGMTGNANAFNTGLTGYSTPINNDISSMLNGGGPDRSTYAGYGWDSQNNSLQPIASQSTNPLDNSTFQNFLNTQTNDITDQIKSQFAGAGYSPTGSGDFSQQLGRGIMQGVAPSFVDAQNNLTNQRMGAANALASNGLGFSGYLNGQDQQFTGNEAAAIQMAPNVMGQQDMGANQVLNLQGMLRNGPLSNIGSAESVLLPLAGLGGTSQTSGTSTTNSNGGIGGILGGLSSIFGGGSGGILGGVGNFLGGLGSFSDRRLKDDIHEIGKLNDGTPVYSFKYKWNPHQTHIGLMAQDVEKYAPEAVHEVEGYKLVDYHKATERAREARGAA